MQRTSFPTPPGLRTLSRLATGWLVALAGCAQFTGAAQPERPPIVRGQPPTELPPIHGSAPVPGASLGAPAVPAPPVPAARTLPLNLDTVLRLAQDQNGQVAVARAKLDEAFAQRDVAALAWLPDLWVGTAFYRHEGGIQDQDGRFIHSSFGALFTGAELHGRFDLREATFQKIDAERKVWQQRGELSRLTSENLLDAANTYVDLLAALSGAAILAERDRNLEDLLKKAESLAKADPGAEVEAARLRAELHGQRLASRKLREGVRSAQAKLVYLLGLPHGAELVPTDRQLVPFTLVDVSAPVEKLIEQALANGPGVRELEGLLNLIQEASARSNSLVQLLPTFDVRVAEGLFGAGPGSRSDWDNRFDLALQARWNLTPLVTARDRRRVADAKRQQAHLSYQDLRGKLTMGVEEAYEAVHSAQEQLALGAQQIKAATEAHDLSRNRLKNRIKGWSYSEVLLAIGSLGRAQLTYIQAVRELDKAQLRLLVLLGLGTQRCEP